LDKNSIRLNKLLARAGVCSRRAADSLIESGNVSVNGRVVSELGTQVNPAEDSVEVNGSKISVEQKKLYLFYKPEGVVTTLSDPHETNTLERYTHKLPVRVFPVGRLDKDAHGLLLLTNDGELTEKLTHPRFQVPRVYIAQVENTLSAKAAKQAANGIELDDGPARASLRARNFDFEVRKHFTKGRVNTSFVEVTIAEGRKHLVKRLLASIGNPVLKLCRVSHGEYSLGDLSPGEIIEHY
jgi:23S rRNA pseudouridine2605 synthase